MRDGNAPPERPSENLPDEENGLLLILPALSLVGVLRKPMFGA